MRYVVVVIACMLALPRVAHAQQADVPGLIKLVENQPADMDRSTWKEKRRDAARRLAESKDRRAVPVLTKLAQTETFDIIGEIAIEGLGTLGDPSAVPTLQQIVGDPSRDKGQRDLARKALAKLGASANAPAPAPPPAPAPAPPPATGPAPAPPETGLETAPRDDSSTRSLLETGSAQPASSMLPELPPLDDDVLAAYNRVTFAAGNAAVNYDTDTKLLQATGNGSGDWQMRVEKPALAYGADAGASVVAGFINPSGRAQTRGTQLAGSGDGEVRFYAGSFYGIARAAADVQVNYTAVIDGTTANNDFKPPTTTDGDFQVAVGGGYGRMLDVGGAIRVRRLARALDANRALGKPIDGATARKLQLTWWALRAERSTYRSLVATIAILREAGVLLGEPDGGLTYEILNVLRDSYLYVRPSGFDANLEFGEGYLRRPAGEVAQDVENGHVEQVLANAGYGTQLDDDKLEIAGTAYARLRVLSPMGNPSPYAIGASLTATRFTYGEHGDPFGTFDLTGTVAYSSDDVMNVDSGLLVGAQLGFTYLINQASGLRLAAQVAEDDGTFLFGATLTATYGLLEGTYSR